MSSYILYLLYTLFVEARAVAGSGNDDDDDDDHDDDRKEKGLTQRN